MNPDKTERDKVLWNDGVYTIKALGGTPVNVVCNDCRHIQLWMCDAEGRLGLYPPPYCVKCQSIDVHIERGGFFIE